MFLIFVISVNYFLDKIIMREKWRKNRMLKLKRR